MRYQVPLRGDKEIKKKIYIRSISKADKQL